MSKVQSVFWSRVTSLRRGVVSTGGGVCIQLVWRASPSSLLARAKEEGSSKGHCLECNNRA